MSELQLQNRPRKNNYFRWTPERIEKARTMLSWATRPTIKAIVREVGAHDEQCIYYAVRKFNLKKTARAKRGQV